MAAIVLISGIIYSASAKTVNPPPPSTPPGPPAPTLAAPANGSSLVQPIGLVWNATSAAGGPIGSYTWQVGTSSAFTTIIASGFTDIDNDSSIPTPTSDKVSGLPNGTYFWRVKASQSTSNGGVDSAWSAVRTFVVTGIGPAPAQPSFSTPTPNASFHILESFKIQWPAVAGAQYYVLEADDEPTFSYPLTLTQSPITFGTQFGALWGNAIANIYYRVRAVSTDGVRSLPSSTLTVHITDAAPTPPAVTQVSPAAGATVTAPFFFDWSDAPNPQVGGYQVDVNTSSSFADTTSALSLPAVTRSDYMITEDLLAPGNYFWRVRALGGDGTGPWSATRAITVVAGPHPTNVGLFAILSEPNNAYGGNSVQARVILDNPAPAGGAVVTIATDMPQVQLPSNTVTIPAGKTDATVSAIATGPVPNNGLSIGIIGDLFAGYASGREQNSLGVLPIYNGLSLSNESIVGGTSAIGTVVLQSPAPPTGTTIRLVSSDSNLVHLPATVVIPAGATDGSFSIMTTAVSASVRIFIDSGTDIDGYRAPRASLVLAPTGSQTPATSLASLSLSAPAIPAGSTVTGTVTLTSPAPAGGSVVTLNASAEGQQIAPASVTVPAGSISATFTTTSAPQVNTPRWAIVQAHDGTSGGSQTRVLEIDPALGAPATLLAIGPSGQDVIGGNPGRASVALIMPAPAGGGVVSLTTDNPTFIHIPPSVSIPEGNSAVSFAIATSPVPTLPTGGNIIASAGGITKSIFVTVAPDPNAPPILQGVTVSPTSVVGGTSLTGTVVLNAPAPPGGVEATLATSNLVASPAPVATVLAGQTTVTFPITTSAVTTDTVVRITAIVGAASRVANLTVTRSGTTTPPPPPPGTLAAPNMASPAADARFAPGTAILFDWSDVSGAANYTVQISAQSNFTTNLITNQNVAASQYSTSILPTETMWWRVRANDTSGNPGNWSATRRFEVKK